MNEPTVYADLHTHTTASDGALAPSDLVRRASKCGIKVLAVTDHDTLSGLREAEDAADDEDIQFVPGVELSTTHEGREIHVLAYGVDGGSTALRDHLGAMQEARRKRVWTIVDRLREEGLDVPSELVTREIGDAHSPGRPHVATALLRADIVDTRSEAFDKYLARGRPGFVGKPDFPVVDAVAMVHEAGGVGILAHPGHWTSSRLIRALRDEGLDGLESIHPSHDSSLQRYYARLAEGYDLLTTGGSDFHGWRDKQGVALGQIGMSREAWERFRDAIA